jgi:hypothetical protein
MTPDRPRLAALLLLVCLCLPIVTRCATPSPTPDTPSPTPTTPTPEEGTAWPDPSYTQSCPMVQPTVELPYLGYPLVPDLPYVDGFVVVTGVRGEIQAVIDRSGQQVEPIVMELPLDFLRQGDVEPPLIFPRNELVIALYAVDDPVAQVVEAINRASLDLRNTGAITVGVFAEPNYVTGQQRVVPPAAAVGVLGAPWDIGGAPWDIGGAVAGAAPGGSATNFWQQWAFSPAMGINLIDAHFSSPTRLVAWTGDQQRVAVFDTSPFPNPGGWAYARWLEGPFSGFVFELCVSHPQPPDLPKTLEPVNGDHESLSDHGLFVAGLVYAVAPAADIHLVRSLNGQAKGDMFWLLANLVQFANTHGAGPSGLNGTVINLSLGVQAPTDPAGQLAVGLPPEIIEFISTTVRADYAVPDQWSAVATPIVALETVLTALNSYSQAVIVAAAGNQSANRDPAGHLPAQAPASYPFVIGVQATNPNRGQACFSNNGDVAAPGGDGDELVTPFEPLPPVPCYPVLDQPPCPSVPDECAFGVVSVAHYGGPRLALWAGTSFAAPLVSGQAALLLQSGAPPGAIPGLITDTVTTPGRVIDVPAALP